MSRNVWAGPEKLCVARKPRIIFQSPECLKNKSIFLTFMNIDKYMHQKSANTVRNSWSLSNFDIMETSPCENDLANPALI